MTPIPFGAGIIPSQMYRYIVLALWEGSGNSCSKTSHPLQPLQLNCAKVSSIHGISNVLSAISFRTALTSLGKADTSKLRKS